MSFAHCDGPSLVAQPGYVRPNLLQSCGFTRVQERLSAGATLAMACFKQLIVVHWLTQCGGARPGATESRSIRSGAFRWFVRSLIRMESTQFSEEVRLDFGYLRAPGIDLLDCLRLVGQPVIFFPVSYGAFQV